MADISRYVSEMKDLILAIEQRAEIQKSLFQLAFICLDSASEGQPEGDVSALLSRILCSLQDMYNKRISSISNEKRKQGLKDLLQKIQNLEEIKQREETEKDNLETQLQETNLKKENLQTEIENLREVNKAALVVLGLRKEFGEFLERYKGSTSSVEELQKQIAQMQRDASERLKIHLRCDKRIAEELERYSKNAEIFNDSVTSLCEAESILSKVDGQLKNFLQKEM